MLQFNVDFRVCVLGCVPYAISQNKLHSSSFGNDNNKNGTANDRTIDRHRWCEMMIISLPYSENSSEKKLWRSGHCTVRVE